MLGIFANKTKIPDVHGRVQWRKKKRKKKAVQKKLTGKKKSAVQVTPVRQDPQDVPGKKTKDAVSRTSGAASVSRLDDEDSDVDFGASYNDSEIEIPSSDEDDELNVLSKRPIGRKKAKVIDKKRKLNMKNRRDEHVDDDIVNTVMGKLDSLDKRFETMSKYLEMCTKKEQLLIDKLEREKETGA